MQNVNLHIGELELICLKNQGELLSGRCMLVVTPKLLEDFLSRQTGELRDFIFTESDRILIELFQKLLPRLPKLSITQKPLQANTSDFELGRFKKLVHLELKHISVNRIRDLSTLKTQLQALYCYRCENVGALSRKGKLQWAELVSLNVRSAPGLDLEEGLSFLGSMPWLQRLELPHNNLSNVDCLGELVNLKYVNLSFNRLRQFPKFNRAAVHLTVLILHNNYLMDISGVQNIPSLIGLDISWNWITDKTKLAPLAELKDLQWITILNNPVTYIKYYRICIATAIRTTYPSSEFVLDHKKLNITEQGVLGTGICVQPRKTDIFGHAQTISPQYQGHKIVGVSTKDKLRKARLINLDAPVEKSTVEPVLDVVKDKGTVEIIDKSKIEPIIDDSDINKKADIIEKMIFDNHSTSKSNGNNVVEENASSRCKETNLEYVSPSKILIHAEINIPSTENVSHEDKPPFFLTANEPSQSSNSLNTGGNTFVSSTPTDYENEEKYFLNQSSSAYSSQGVDTIPTDSLTSSTEIQNRPETETQIESPKNSGLDSNGSETPQITTDEENFEDCIQASEPSLNSETDNDASSSKICHNETQTYDDAYDDNDDDNSGESDSDGCDTLWQIQRLDKATNTTKTLLLALLDKELKERCPINGHTLNKWPLDSIQSCVKIKSDPILIELEFHPEKKERVFRSYIMEFSDAQTLMKKMYSILENRALCDMNQYTYKCLKCSSLFVHSRPSRSKYLEVQVQCALCGHSNVIEIEEPRLPENTLSPNKSLSHSPSDSSVGSSISFDHKTKSENMGRIQKYESDVEIISNPSQSSIEVIDEHTSGTPARKRSSEERQTVAVPQLVTVPEIIPPLSTLTESSSSGSLTESVITAYETSNIFNKKPQTKECFPEENNEISPEIDKYTTNTRGTLDGESENKPTNVNKSPEDIYSYKNFGQVDHRIKQYLYQTLFQNENENLLAFAKCHLWKTGGLDFNGCFVLSTTSVYILYHSPTDFSGLSCDWLSKNETFPLKDLKQISSLVWYQGIDVKLNKISYILLFMDQDRTKYFLKYISDLSLQTFNIITTPNPKIELSLQRAVISAKFSYKPADPSIHFFSVCQSITIVKDENFEETIRLGGLIITHGEFYILPGDLSWMTSTWSPNIDSYKEMSSLIEVKRKGLTLVLHFLDEEMALEEIWSIKLATNNQLLCMIDAIKGPWETLFLEPLEISFHY